MKYKNIIKRSIYFSNDNFKTISFCFLLTRNGRIEDRWTKSDVATLL